MVTQAVPHCSPWRTPCQSRWMCLEGSCSPWRVAHAEQPLGRSWSPWRGALTGEGFLTESVTLWGNHAGAVY